MMIVSRRPTRLCLGRVVACAAFLAASIGGHRAASAAADPNADSTGHALAGPYCTINDCDGQPADSGGDACFDSTAFDLSIGDLQLVCGDNTPAGMNNESCSLLAFDPIWWESFTIDQCADVLIDFCCTEFVHPTYYSVLSKDCPDCEIIYAETGPECNHARDCELRAYSHCVEDQAGGEYCRDFGFGEDGPRECAGGNPSVIWRNLTPGTYYYPIYSCDDPELCDPVTARGAYQIHIEVLPPSLAPGGCCFPDPPDAIHIESAASILAHGPDAIELAIDLDASFGIEPRRGGPKRIAFDMDADIDGATVHPGNVQITCALGPAPAVIAATLSGSDTVVVEIDAMTKLDCCQFAFAGVLGAAGGNVDDTYYVRGIEGDVNFSGAVTGGDALLVKPHFGEIAGIDLVAGQWDYDLSGGVTGGDFALIKPRFGDAGASCPVIPGRACLEVACAGDCIALGGVFLGDGVDCGDGTICESGACCLDGGRRCEVLTVDECLAQGGSFDGPGQDCNPDCTCVPDENGADTCDALGDAVLIPTDGTKITFAGNTTLARDIDCPLLAPDKTWWEKIELDECSTLYINFCCMHPGIQFPGAQSILFAGCPCGRTTRANASPDEFCDDNNTTFGFSNIGPGVYYYPVRACDDPDNCDLNGWPLGPYRMHMFAEPEEPEPCCLPNEDACQLLCRGECRLRGGIPPGGADCGPEDACATGACCLGGHNECQETDMATCVSMGGSYIGSVGCDDGPCIANDFCDDAVLIECNSLTDANNQFAMTTPDEPGYRCHSAGVGVPGIGNVWFKFVATHTTARLHTCESDPPADDSVLAMYEVGDPNDPCNTLTEIGCYDDVAGCIVETGFGSDFTVENLNIGETYYVQLGCWTDNDRGNYQLRVLCPALSGACCYDDNGQFVCQEGLEEAECDALGGRYGGLNSVCGPPGDPMEIDPPCGIGACCRGDDLGFCALLGEAECEALCPSCSWQGDGISCTDPMNPCAGSCCTGDGDACVVTTEAGCLDDPPGGLGGVVWTRYLACNDPGIDCDGANENVCTLLETNCHLSDQQGHGFGDTKYVQSDRSIFTQSRVADSFVPTASPISSECWWGMYANFQQQNPNCTANDDFRVTYYRSDGPSGLPGSIVRQSNIGVTKSLTGNVFLNDSGNIIAEWEYRGGNHPTAAVTAGQCTWFEVTNDTGFQNCRWYWATSGDGDELSVVDANHINGYEVGEERTFDLAWCADVAIEADDCE